MLTFTDSAREMVRSFAQFSEHATLRIALVGSPVAPEYEFTLIDEEPGDGDVVVEQDGFRVLLDEGSAPRLEGATVDWIETPGGAGFDVRNPNLARPAAPQGPLAARVQQVLDERINPSVASHGGRITLVDVRGDAVYIQMDGGCQGCGLARVTLRQGVERMLRQAIPEVGELIDITDHESGTNPYYAAG